MPSNVQLNAGAGGVLAATKQITHDGDTSHLQMMGLFGLTGTEDSYTAGLINGDSANGLDVDVTRMEPGFGALNLGKREDDAAANADVGVAILGVRRDTDSVATSADGDYTQLSTDSSGRLKVAPGVTADGGAMPYKNLNVNTTPVDIKAAPGKLFWIHVMNLSATKKYLKFFNVAAASVTLGVTVPVLTFPIPTMADTNGAGFTINFGPGVQFSTAMSIAATAGIADNDVSAPAANDVVLNGGFA